MTDTIKLRRAAPADRAECSRICYEAFAGINARHGFPPDFPDLTIAGGMIEFTLSAPKVYGVVATTGDGRIVGSNFLWEGGLIFGIGPITVDPSVQAQSIGRRLMEAVLDRAREQNAAGVRLCQAAFNTRSMSLYTKLGFDVREPLVCMQGTPPRVRLDGYAVRPMNEADIDACCALCRDIHGHDRRGELPFGLSQGTASVVEHDGRIVGYATDIGFFAHAVARGDAGLMALISATPQISGPGFLLPSRNARMFRWCLANGLKVVQPMTLMSTGLYNEPRGAFLPSILF